MRIKHLNIVSMNRYIPATHVTQTQHHTHNPIPQQPHPTNEQVLYSGIFTDEKVLQLLYILRNLSDQVFAKLHEVANEGQPSTSEYANRFLKGLTSIEYWRPEIKLSEVNTAVEEYPEFGLLYKYTLLRYLKELHKYERAAQIPVNIPPLHDFLHSYYVALAKSKFMQRLEFLDVYGMERTHMHMETLRTVLMELTRHSVYRGLQADFDGLVSVEKDITPWDSISQHGSESENENGHGHDLNSLSHRHNSPPPPPRRRDNRDVTNERPSLSPPHNRISHHNNKHHNNNHHDTHHTHHNRDYNTNYNNTKDHRELSPSPSPPAAHNHTMRIKL
jgi:hypothetical protein